jgi:hypothetical protein
MNKFHISPTKFCFFPSNRLFGHNADSRLHFLFPSTRITHQWIHAVETPFAASGFYFGGPTSRGPTSQTPFYQAKKYFNEGFDEDTVA